MFNGVKGRLLAVLLVALLVFLAGCLESKGGLFDRYLNDSENPNPADSNNAGTQNPGGNQNQGQTQEPVIQIGEAVAECKTRGNIAKIDTCLINLAKEYKTIGPCNDLGLLPSDRCYQSVAQVSGNDAHCAIIADLELKSECFRDIGIKNRNAEICGKILADQEYRDECFDSVARANSDQKACASVFAPDTRDQCYLAVAQRTRTTSFCHLVSPSRENGTYLRDSCYKASGTVLLGEVCAVLLDENKRAECFEDARDIPIDAGAINCGSFSDTNSERNCNYWLGSYAGDFNACYELSGATFTNCMNNAVKVSPTAEKCGLIKNSDYDLRNECYKNAAITALDENQCDNILSNSRVREKCLLEIGVAKNDEIICQTIGRSNITWKHECLERIAVKTGDYELCSKISTDRDYVDCYAQVALSFGAPELCDFAERENLKLLPYEGKYYCYNNYAIDAKSQRACDKIKYKDLRQSCTDGVEIALLCNDNDDVCDEDFCTYTTDNDCKSPDYCISSADCNDGRVTTKDTCNFAENTCIYTNITECIDNDRYCPSICTYTGDIFASVVNETTGLTNEDSDCLAPCLIAGGEVCDEGTTCNPGYGVSAQEAQCCEINEETDEPYCG
ncbi:MAG: hypothetical protein NUV67_04840 [archaeon]|nr:hypothetical protein [archaeon]